MPNRSPNRSTESNNFYRVLTGVLVIAPHVPVGTLLNPMKTIERIDDQTTVHARVVMSPMTDMPELFDEWREEFNALLIPDVLPLPVRRDGRLVYEDTWFLNEHELRLEVTAPFVPTEFTGILWHQGQAIHWRATLDLDACRESAGSIRKSIYGFTVVQEEHP